MRYIYMVLIESTVEKQRGKRQNLVLEMNNNSVNRNVLTVKYIKKILTDESVIYIILFVIVAENLFRKSISINDKLFY